MKIFKKIASVLVASCFMLSIANLPAYSATVTNSTKYGDGYSLQAPYASPSKMAKVQIKPKKAAKTVKKTSKNTAKKTSAKLANNIIKKYAKTGLSLLKKLANKLKLSLSAVYNKFVKFGVTKAQIKKVAPVISKQIRKGVGFSNCASLAVSKYLNISKGLAAIQNLAADIVSGEYLSVNSKTFKGVIATSNGDKLTLQKNGHKNANNYRLGLNYFMAGLRKGEKAILSVRCDSGNGHAIMVTKEKNGKYGVYDINEQGGKKVVYSKAKFIKLMKGSSYYKATDDDGCLSVLTDSKSIAKKEAEYELKNSNAYKISKELNSKINELLEDKNLNNLQRTWLKQANTMISKTIKSSKSLEDKHWLILSAMDSIDFIVSEKASMLSLAEVSYEPEGTSFSGNIFYPLRTILKDDPTYKEYIQNIENNQ